MIIAYDDNGDNKNEDDELDDDDNNNNNASTECLQITRKSQANRIHSFYFILPTFYFI